MTVKINKPDINIREKLSEIDKPVGAAGQDMIAAETSQQQFNLIGAGRKNLLINPMFEVSQRGNYQVDNGGTGWTASSATYGVDRWYAYGNGVAVTTSTSEQTLPTGQTVLALKSVATASSASSFLHPAQNFEVARWMEGQDFTYSCWVRTNRVGQYVRMCNTLGCHTISEEVPADGEWHFMTGTKNMGTGINLTGSAQFQPAFGGGALATGDYVEFALPQVEHGRVATPFEYRSYNEEFKLCQRYYQRFDADGQDYTNIGIAVGTTASGSTKWYVPINLPGGRMRTDPTVSFSAASDFRCTLQHSNSDNCSAIIIGYGNPITPNLAVTAGSSVAGVIRMFGYSANANAFLAFDAEV